MNLKAAAGPPPDTNGLQQAQARFNRFPDAAPPGLAGRARLDRGWCAWLAGDANQRSGRFRSRREPARLPSEDLAVAKFKIGDVLFGRKDFAGALENYRAVLDDFTNFPNVDAGAWRPRAVSKPAREPGI